VDPDPASPHEVVDRLLAGIGEARWDDLADLYAEDAVVDQPLMAPERVRINGREEVRAHFSSASHTPLEVRPHNVVVHVTTDPEVIIAEFDYDVRNTETGRESTVANVQVLRVRGGLIIATRDYHDHLRLAATAGSAHQLAATLD
jgi:ketosteroid isomerase-like protein